MAFDPSSVAGLVEHWNPDTIDTGDGAQIGTWTGSENSLALAGPGSPNNPTLMRPQQHHCRKKSVLFNGTNERLSVSDASLNNAEWTYMLVVCWYDALGTAQYALNKVNTNSATVSLKLDSGQTEAGVRLDGAEGTFEQAQASADGRTATPHVVTIRYDGSELILRLDGVEVASNSVSGATDTDNAGALVVGNHDSSFESMHGFVGDIAVWDNAISDVNMAAQESALMTDWQIDAYNAAWTTGSRADIITPDTGEGETEILSPSLVHDGTSTYYLFFAEQGGNNINYATAADSSDLTNPASWTRNAVASPIITATGDSPPNCRGVNAIRDGSTWHILVDGGDGDLYHFTGTSLASLTDNGSVYSGLGSSGNIEHARHPCILPDQEGGKWVVYFDGRLSDATGGVGSIGRVTTADFSTWDTATEVLSPGDLWWEATDLGTPHVKIIDGTYVMLYASYNTANVQSEAPHWIGIARSSDGITWERPSEDVPFLSPAQGESEVSVTGPELLPDNSAFFYISRDAATDADISVIDTGSLFDSFIDPPVLTTDWNRKVELTIDSGQKQGTPSGIVLTITEDALPAEMFSGGANPARRFGGDLRATSDEAGTTEIPLDVGFPHTDFVAGVAQLTVNFDDLSSDAFWLWYNLDVPERATLPLKAATYGQHAVYPSRYEAFYSLDEDPYTEGNSNRPSFEDRTGNGNDLEGITTATTDGVACQIGNGVEFPADINQRLTLGTPHDIALGEAGDDLSVMCWYEPNTVSGTYAIVAIDGSWSLRQEDDDLFLRTIGSAPSITTVFAADNPAHVAFAWDVGTDVSLWVDGTEANSANTDTSNASAAFEVGRRGASDALNGTVDQLAVLLGILTDDDVNTVYNCESDNAAFWDTGTPQDASGGSSEAAKASGLSLGMSLSL